MKIIKTRLLLLMLFAIVSENVFAQANNKGSFTINFGPEIAVPEIRFRETHKNGFGGSFKSEYTFGKHGSVILNGGVTTFSGRTFYRGILLSDGRHRELVAIPVKTGGRYYLGNFYAQAEAGVVFLKQFRNSTNAVFSLGAGDKLRLGKQVFDISLRQEMWLRRDGNYNMAVLRIAYEINL